MQLSKVKNTRDVNVTLIVCIESNNLFLKTQGSLAHDIIF